MISEIDFRCLQPREKNKTVEAISDQSYNCFVKTSLQEVFRLILTHLEESVNSDWSAVSVSEMKQILIESIDLLNDGKGIDVQLLKTAFAPTSFLQEIAMANNWSNEYIELAETFDSLIEG